VKNSEDIKRNDRSGSELQWGEGKYRYLVENINDVIFSLDQKGSITYISPVIESLIGYAPSELLGRPFSEFIYKQDLRSLYEQFEKVLSGNLEPSEYRILTKSEDVRWVQLSSLPVMDGDTVIGLQGVLSDITKVRRLQDKLIRSERLAATGQLAASIAHEINSPLQAVITMLGTMQKKYEDDNELSGNLELLKAAFGSIRNTVQNLLDLNRPGSEVKQPTNVNNIIEKTVELLRYHLKKSAVRVNLDLSSNLPVIQASPQQLNHVILNLINNAIEALSGTSKSKKGWKREAAEGEEIRIETGLEAENIVVRITDTGPGISEEDLNHIFDPFYTRKKKMGIGIGLSVCDGIIQEHNGTITAENIDGGGAVLTISLPVV